MAPTIDWFTLTIGFALAVHLTYNRLEPRKLRYHFCLLVGVPIGLVTFLKPYFPSILSTGIHVYPVFFSTLITSVVLYRLSPFHPLAHLPGPVWNRISQLTMCKVAVGGKRYLYMKHIHETYGPIVRLGPNLISISDEGAVQPILGPKGIHRGEMHETMLLDKDQINLLTETNAQKHAEMRKTWHRGLTPTAIKAYDPIIARRTFQLVECLGQQKGNIDLGKWISFYKFDFMGDLVFGGGFELMEAGGDPHGWWAMQTEGVAVLGVLGHIPWINSFLKLIPLGAKTRRAQEFGHVAAQRRARAGSMTQDLFYYFAEEDKPEAQRPSMKRVALDGWVAILAAADTTSSTMAGTFFHLLQDRRTLDRLRAEVDSTFDRGEEISDHGKLAEMPYLTACINETLRLMPPVPSLLQRSSPKGHGPTVVCGRIIPEGSHVMIPNYTLFRDPRYFFPDPDTFWPERWLIAASDSQEKPPPGFIHNTAVYIPFSFGPANCLGKQLAYREMRMVIANIIQKYDIRFPDTYKPEKYLQDLRDDTVLTKGELPVILTKRF